MEKKKTKMNPKKHQKKAKIIKGVKIAGSAVVTIGTIGYGIAKQVIKKNSSLAHEGCFESINNHYMI